MNVSFSFLHIIITIYVSKISLYALLLHVDESKSTVKFFIFYKTWSYWSDTFSFYKIEVKFWNLIENVDLNCFDTIRRHLSLKFNKYMQFRDSNVIYESNSQ